MACQYALYSVPSSLCPPGQRVEIGLGSKLVRIYHRGRLLKLHPRQPRGGRSTDAADYPTELTAYTLRAPEGIKRSAAEQGPAVADFADRLFDGRLPWAKVRQAHKLVRPRQCQFSSHTCLRVVPRSYRSAQSGPRTLSLRA